MSDDDQPVTRGVLSGEMAVLRAEMAEQAAQLRGEMKTMESRLVLMIADSAQRTVDLMAAMEGRLRRDLGAEIARHSDALFDRLVVMFSGSNDQTRALDDRVSQQERRLAEHVADDRRHRKQRR